MFRKMMNVTLVASLLAGCGEGEEIYDSGSDAGLGDLDDDGEDEDDQGAEDDDGEPVDPKPHEPEDDPSDDLTSRVLWSGSENGDLLIHATVSEEVVEAFDGQAAYYAMRIRPDGSLYLAVNNEQDETIELLNVRSTAQGHYFVDQPVVQMCFPFPQLPPIVNNCTVQPCPWEEGGWPFPGEPWPNCVEVGAPTAGDDVVSVMGAIDGQLFAANMQQGEDPDDPIEEILTVGRRHYAKTLSLVLDDLQSLEPELEPFGVDCLGCMAIGSWLASTALECAVQLDVSACIDVYWAKKLYDEKCEGSCG